MPSELGVKYCGSNGRETTDLLSVSAEQSRWRGCGQGMFLPDALIWNKK